MSAPKYRKKLVNEFSKMSVQDSENKPSQQERPSHEIPIAVGSEPLRGERPSHRRDARTEIFETKVADKNMIKRNKLKTQMCKRFTETGYCHFGKGCHFAHYQSEIREAVCLFGDKCKDKKNCGYDHTTEEIPELPPVEQPAPKMWEVEVSPVTKEEEMVVELEPEDTFKIHDKPNKLDKLKKMMEEAEKDADFKLEMMNMMKSYLRETFKEDNTVYIENTGKKSVKFIAIECDDDEFEGIIERIYQ